MTKRKDRFQNNGIISLIISPPSSLLLLGVASIALPLVFLIAIASVTTVNEVVHARGQLLLENTFKLKSPGDTVITEALIEEGNPVSQGKPIARTASGSTIDAGFSGRLIQRFFSRGTEVKTGELLAIFGPEKPEWMVKMAVDPRTATRIRIGQSVRIQFPGFARKTGEGKVSAVLERALPVQDGEDLVKVAYRITMDQDPELTDWLNSNEANVHGALAEISVITGKSVLLDKAVNHVLKR